MVRKLKNGRRTSQRDLFHPFIHSPEVAESAGVEKIPTVLFINSDGLIEQRKLQE